METETVGSLAVEEEADHAAVTVAMDDGALLAVDALRDVSIAFDMSFYGTERCHHELQDNFRAVRRTLWHFLGMVRAGKPSLAP